MKNKQILVVDWDSTVIDTSKTIINLHNKLFENKIEYIKDHDWKFKPMINSEEELKELFKLFDNEHFYDKGVIEPINNAIESIKMLSETYKIVICSKHEVSRRKLTRKYIEETFKNHDVSVKFVNSFNEKANLFKNKDVKAVIDDKIECFEGFNDNCIKILFGDYQWNRNCSGNFSKISDWVLVTELLLNKNR